MAKKKNGVPEYTPEFFGWQYPIHVNGAFCCVDDLPGHISIWRSFNGWWVFTLDVMAIHIIVENCVLETGMQMFKDRISQLHTALGVIIEKEDT